MQTNTRRFVIPSAHEVSFKFLTGQVNFAGRPFYMLGITGFKVSLCLAYIRLVAKQRTYRRLTWWIMITCVLTHFGGILVLLFQCKPVGPLTRHAETTKNFY